MAEHSSPLFLIGATGTGKSTAALELARGWSDAAILCLDAMQVYRGADIGTSKPSREERAEFPHGGLNLVNLGEPFDVAAYLRHATEFLREQNAAGRRVIVVGGTGLYFRALTRGLCEAPQGSLELRAELSSLTTEQLRERLARVDPDMLTRLDAANPRRLSRAIEVMEATGKSLREWQDETPEPLVKNCTAIWIEREKEELNARLEKRVAEMFAMGWEAEVRGLVEKYGAGKVAAFPAIGYREIAEAMEFENEESTPSYMSHGSHKSHPSSENLAGDILVATRQYAKRQLTWFARESNLVPVMLTGNQTLSEGLDASPLWNLPNLL